MGVRLVRYNNEVVTGSGDYGSGDYDGTYDHNELINRDLANQHPISAITGLQKSLNDLKAVDLVKNYKDSISIHFDVDKSIISQKALTANVKIFDSEDNAIQEMDIGSLTVNNKSRGLFVDKYPEIKIKDTTSIHLSDEEDGETLKKMFDGHKVFSHYGGTENVYNEKEANGWYFYKMFNSLLQPNGTRTFNGIVSRAKYRTYTHRAKIRSTDGGSNLNGLVIAYVLDKDGHPHTLSCVVTRGGWGNYETLAYAIVYNRYLDGGQIVKKFNVNRQEFFSGSWVDRFIILEVSKSANIIKCMISDWCNMSDWNSEDINPNPKKTLSINLHNYDWGHYFTGKVQYGYCNEAQRDSYFNTIYFSGKGSLKAEAIISPDDGNTLEIRDNGLYCADNGINDEAHNHENYNILKEFSEASDSTLLYKGNPIGSGSVTISEEDSNAIQEKTDGLFVLDLSSHLLKTVLSSDGIHGLRYYNSKLQYQNINGAWVSISTGGSSGGTGDIVISPSVNNILTKYSNGYYVPGFLTSSQINNAIQKLSDGYYVPAIPANNATTDDIDVAVDDIENKFVEQSQTFNERYDILTTKIQRVAANTTKSQIHEFSGSNPISIETVIDISTLYDLSTDVILNLEFMIKNISTVDTLTVQILENDTEVLKDILTKSETQRYKLPNIPNIEILIKGDYKLFLYVHYI